jgi:hypothetical protein
VKAARGATIASQATASSLGTSGAGVSTIIAILSA